MISKLNFIHLYRVSSIELSNQLMIYDWIIIYGESENTRYKTDSSITFRHVKINFEQNIYCFRKKVSVIDFCKFNLILSVILYRFRFDQNRHTYKFVFVRLWLCIFSIFLYFWFLYCLLLHFIQQDIFFLFGQNNSFNQKYNFLYISMYKEANNTIHARQIKWVWTNIDPP